MSELCNQIGYYYFMNRIMFSDVILGIRLGNQSQMTVWSYHFLYPMGYIP